MTMCMQSAVSIPVCTLGNRTRQIGLFRPAIMECLGMLAAHWWFLAIFCMKNLICGVSCCGGSINGAKKKYMLWYIIYILYKVLWYWKLSPNYCQQMPHSLPKRLTHWDRDNMAAIFQTIFSNAFSWMKIYAFRLKFHWSLFLRVKLTIFQHWFR